MTDNLHLKGENMFSEDLNLARQAARAAADIIRGNFSLPKSIENKGAGNGLVTDTDTKAEAAILELLQKNSPYAILSEESGAIAGDGDMRWITDPLDGTTNFCNGVPLFAVSIALFRDNEPVLGVIVHPVTGDEYYAVQGGGAFLNDQLIKPSKINHPSETVLFINHGTAQTDRRRYGDVSSVLVKNHALRALGTTALELAYVASGRAGAFICSGDHLWDYAAGILLVSEAGGIVSDWHGRPRDGSNNYVLAAHPDLHPHLVEKLKKFQ
jgi:myo-inositol-1(or 4)-monophosphatase